MKKNLIALAAGLCSICTVKAQTEKGNQTLGLNLRYSYSKSNDVTTPVVGIPTALPNKSTVFNIAPTYTYFIADNLELGLDVGWSTSRQENSYGSGVDIQNNKTWSSGLYLRKYVLYKNKIGFRAGGRFGYSHYKDNYSNSLTAIYNTEYRGNVLTGSLMFDLVYYPSNKIGLAANIINASYNHQRADTGTYGVTSADSFNINFINSGPLISFFYTFGSK